MSETTTSKKSGGIGGVVKTTLGGFKNAPLPTKIATGVVSGLLTVGGFFIGRATKKGKK